MRRCVFHIGLHKTGTSSIQRSLFHVRDALRARGIGYFPGRGNHSYLTGCFDARLVAMPRVLAPMTPSFAARPAFWNRARQEFERYLAESEAEIEIVSGEGFTQLPKAKLAELKTFLERYFDEIEIIAYVREPFGGFTSRAQQLVKSGQSFEEIKAGLHAAPEGPDDLVAQSVLPKYRLRLEKFIETFPTVHIRSFDRSALKGGDVVTDFLDVSLGRSPGELGVEVLRANESLSNTAVHLLEAINRRIPYLKGKDYNPTRARSIVPALAKLDPADRFQMPGIDWHEVRDLVAEDVVWLAEATEGRIDFRDTPPPAQSEASPPQIDIEAEALRFHEQVRAAEQAEQRKLVTSSIARFRKRGVAPSADGQPVKTLLAHTDADFVLASLREMREAGWRDSVLALVAEYPWAVIAPERQAEAEAIAKSLAAAPA
ncbi:hypothetical protein V6C03_06625 [Methyloligella sp. 2.7D]|uniref:hypothetical protein n=1 Tax=unclassified Methyloligella TaxID=2625955 RepID=UPI00157CE2C0|nr:hypothetical protein [Methyloligella sp. GL2]QKP78425.1 hypothetical protein HT051_13825 [Methyloligella sp. GL2]